MEPFEHEPEHEHEPELNGDPITRPLAHCPVCKSSRLDPVVENERQTVHLLCRDCSRCWHVELGYVHRMTPATCLGCPEQARCQAAYEADQASSRA